MAKAEKIDEVVETKTVVVEPAKIVLELTPDEAAAVAAVLGRCCVHGPVAGVYLALRDIAERRPYRITASVTSTGTVRAITLNG